MSPRIWANISPRQLLSSKIRSSMSWDGFIYNMIKEKAMCRNIKTLYNFDPPATEEEIQAASLQFVRKLSGFNEPSKANEVAFNSAIKEMAVVARNLLNSLVTNAEHRNREVEIERVRSRAAKRF